MSAVICARILFSVNSFEPTLKDVPESLPFVPPPELPPLLLQAARTMADVTTSAVIAVGREMRSRIMVSFPSCWTTGEFNRSTQRPPQCSGRELRPPPVRRSGLPGHHGRSVATTGGTHHVLETPRAQQILGHAGEVIDEQCENGREDGACE